MQNNSKPNVIITRKGVEQFKHILIDQKLPSIEKKHSKRNDYSNSKVPIIKYPRGGTFFETVTDEDGLEYLNVIDDEKINKNAE